LDEATLLFLPLFSRVLADLFFGGGGGNRRREYFVLFFFQTNEEERLDGKNGQERKFRERQRESERSAREKPTNRRVDINAKTIECTGGLLRGTRSAEMVAK
jgi:hypothetical protein